MMKFLSGLAAVTLAVFLTADLAAATTAAFECQFYKKRVEFDPNGNQITTWVPQGNHLHTDGHGSSVPSGIYCFGTCTDPSCVCDEDADNITKDNGAFQKPTKYTSHDCACDPVAPPNPPAISEFEGTLLLSN